MLIDPYLSQSSEIFSLLVAALFTAQVLSVYGQCSLDLKPLSADNPDLASCKGRTVSSTCCDKLNTIENTIAYSNPNLYLAVVTNSGSQSGCVAVSSSDCADLTVQIPKTSIQFCRLTKAHSMSVESQLMSFPLVHHPACSVSLLLMQPTAAHLFFYKMFFHSMYIMQTDFGL